MVNEQERLDAIFGALADPTRRRILIALSHDPGKPVASLAKPFRISPPAISRHLRVLEKARLVDRRRRGRVHMIRAKPEGIGPARQWMQQYAEAWAFSFDTLDRLLAKESAKGEQT